MTERIDYEIGSDWDMSFTDWNDLKTIRDEDVLRQNFVLIMAEIVDQYVGGHTTSTQQSRIKRRVEERFLQETAVDFVDVREFEIDERTLSFRAIIGSDEFSDTITL